MIHEALSFLRTHVNVALQTMSGRGLDALAEDRVVFLDGEEVDDSLRFKPNAVTLLLVNLAEEKTMRPADPFSRLNAAGVARKALPEIRMALHVLFVARFKEYGESLSHISRIVQYFQGRPVLNRQNAPDLDGGLEHLALELVSLSFAEQNELWGGLRTPYQPSVLYRVRLVMFRDEEEGPASRVNTVRLVTGP